MMRIRAVFFLFLILLACPRLSFSADAGSIAGVVRDQDGKPLADVRVTLSGSGNSTHRETSSNAGGQFHFVALAAGDYALTAELSGYIAKASASIHLESSTANASAELILLRSPSTAAAEIVEAAPTPKPALKFQASGIRGLIDPGGYSASTSGAATGLLRGIADVRRTDRSFVATGAREWPCSLEPDLQKAVAEHPDQVEPNRRLGQWYLAHSQPAKAIPLLKHVVQLDASDNAASRDLAIAWLQSGAFDEARKLLTALIAQHDKAEVHQLLARACEGSGMFREAAEQYRIAESEESSEESIFGQGYELILAGTPADAVPVFQAGERRYSQSTSLRIGSGTAQFLVGRTGESLRSFLDATDIDPADPRPYEFLAATAGAWGDESQRIRASLKRYVERKPDRAAANYFYAMALAHDPANAEGSRIESLLKQAIALDPNLAKAHLQLADLYAERNAFTEAVPEYQTALRLAPELNEAHYRLAIAYKRSDHAEESAREMQAFQQSKARGVVESAKTGVNLAEFISVMNLPDAAGNQPESATQCASAAHMD